MHITEAENAGKAVLKLNGDLMVGNMADVHKAILTLSGDSGALILDLSEVSDCDTAGAQLLEAAAKGDGRHDNGLVIEGVSPALKAALERVGLGLGWPEREQEDIVDA